MNSIPTYLRRHTAQLVALACLTVFATGCPLGPALDTGGGTGGTDSGTGKVTTILTADSASAKSIVQSILKQEDDFLPLEDIERFNVTVNQIVFVPTSELGGEGEGDEGAEGEGEGQVDEGAEGEGEGETAKQNEVPPSHVLVFEGALDVNLMDLLGVSEVLTSAEIPADTYGQIRLSISNPRLVLAADPETELTNIQLTANGRLFVEQEFEIPADQNSLIRIDFGGVNIVATGGGDYVLTPSMDVSLNVSDAAVLVMGTIVELNPDDDTLVLAIDDSEDQITVDYAAAEIVLADETVGSEADLAVDIRVDVRGTAALDGTVSAEMIALL